MASDRSEKELVITPMTRADVPEIQAIEALSFPRVWPADAYEVELARPTSVYYVARQAGQASEGGAVVGYGGLWLQADAAHVSTLAVHPDARRRGIAAALLMRLLEVAIAAGSPEVTLEVRVSNQAALALYGRFGFLEAGRRPGYYSDNGEDALILTTPPLTDPAWRSRVAGLGVDRPPPAADG